MNRQPYHHSPIGTHHYYDEDLDRVQDMGNGVTLHFITRKNVKKPTSWSIVVKKNNIHCGCVTNVRGYNVHVWMASALLDARIRGLATEADAINAINLLAGSIFP